MVVVVVVVGVGVGVGVVVVSSSSAHVSRCYADGSAHGKHDITATT